MIRAGFYSWLPGVGRKTDIDTRGGSLVVILSVKCHTVTLKVHLHSLEAAKNKGNVTNADCETEQLVIAADNDRVNSRTNTGWKRIQIEDATHKYVSTHTQRYTTVCPTHIT